MSLRSAETTRPAGGWVLHVTNIPTPYRLPYYRELRKGLLAEGKDFSVFFLGQGKRQRAWKIGDEEFDGFDHTVGDPGGNILRQVKRRIDELEPSVVVLAWAMDMLALSLLFHCRSRKIPVVVVSGETEHTYRSGRMRAARGLLRRLFFALASGFISYGTRAAEYLRNRGIPGDRVSIAINVVDTGFFARRVLELRDSGEAALQRSSYRTSEGGEFDSHILFVGELLARKGVVATLDALQRVADPRVALHIVGSGEEEQRIRGHAAAAGLSAQVFFHGYRQKEELPLFYAMADFLLFPSFEEIFGLVLVEAAAAGLPIVASSTAGGTIDVVDDGVTGLVVDPRDIEKYSEAIASLAGSPELRQSMGRLAHEKASQSLTLTHSARGYIQAVRKHAR